MTESNHYVSVAPVCGLIGTIAGMLAAFKIIATSPQPPGFSDLCFPIIIAEAITCLLLLAHAIIKRHNQ